MKTPTRWIAAFGACLVLSLGSTPVATAARTSAAPATSPVSVAAPTAQLPAGWRTRLAAVTAALGLDRTPAAQALDRAINPGDFQCGPTDFDAYLDQLFAAMTDEDLAFLDNTPALAIPTLDAILFGSSADADYALPRTYAHLLGGTFRDVKRFWDIRSDDIQLHAMHGDMLQDTARVARVLRVVFGVGAADAADLAGFIADTVAASPALDGGNNPLFTLNAFAFSTQGNPDPLFAGVPDKLVFGDGLLDSLEFMGIPNIGPRAVLGHEFGHHVQLEDHLFDSPLTGPEATRRTELMADAFGTYFATHARGLALNAQRVLQAERTFFEGGDCAFDDPGHHGTPHQRLRAATWAADLANAARPQGHILPSLGFAALFDAKLPELVAPDAP